MLYTVDLLTANVSEWLDRCPVAAVMGLKPCETLQELVVKSVARSGAGASAVLD